MLAPFYKPLEYNKILERLTAKAISPAGKRLASDLAPATYLSEIQKNQALTTTAVDMILKRGSLPLGGIKEVDALITRAERGGVLGISDLLAVADFLHVSKKIHNYAQIDNAEHVFTLLEDYFSMVAPLPTLEKELERTIANEQELKDNASRELLSIRNQIKAANAKIKERLNNIINSNQYKTMLQDHVVTQRAGRFCVPVRSEYKNSFPGIVHDQSSTGATVFIEPMGVVNVNNRIKELGAEEKEEIEKILTRLSHQVGEQHQVLTTNAKVLTELDFIFAKGELSIEMNAIEPHLNETGYINIEKGRHPLIDPKVVVPLTIYLGKDFNTLMITGPNTGGKTVSLKVVGLLTVMAQAGLHVPAADAQIAVFDNVFADIGDEQSIEQSLSTFSAHMSNIVKILDKATPRSLVLLDELGSGTDPTEGSALAISIIEYLHRNNIRTAITTHYSQLKIYALATEGVENASCEFDISTLAPTYKLLIGVPGKSNAFAISKKLGLSDSIIDAAKQVLSSGEENLEDVIADLETSKKQSVIEQEKLASYRQDAEKLKIRLAEQRQKFELQKEKILKKAREDATAILRSAEEQASSIIKEMVAKSKQANVGEMDNLRKQITHKITEVQPKVKPPKPPKSLKLGDNVYSHTLGYSGVVSALPDNKGNVEIRAGIMKMKVPLSDLSHDKDADKREADLWKEPHKKQNRNPGSNLKTNKATHISANLDIRGTLVHEGIEILSKYIDDAYLASLKQVQIVHGKGTGALREAVHDYLRRSGQVDSFRIGKFGEGDHGVTIVELR